MEAKDYILNLTAEQIKTIYNYHIEADELNEDEYFNLIYIIGESIIEQARANKVEFGDIG